MDDVAFGLALRRVRLRRNERQVDVAARAGISQSEYSLIERGHLDGIPLRTIRAAAAALEVRVNLVARWRGGDLDRLLHGRHAAMGEAVTARLLKAAWEVLPEVSFNHYGERGVIDLVGWHRLHATLLIVELKTEVVDPNELLGTMDRRRRLSFRVASDHGWIPAHVGAWIVVADSRANRRRAAEFRELLRAAFPEDGRSVDGWARSPARDQSALWFLSDTSPRGLGRTLAPRKRVYRPRPRSAPALAS
jgi:transcriptional regulator with XRE-family HTH domain